MDRRAFCTAVAACAVSPAARGTTAWPSRPLRIVTAGAGSVTDIRARWLAERLGAVLGQPVIVENKPGAGGIIAMETGARSAPDGHTLVVVHQGTVAVNPFIYASLSYDPFRDFTPLTRLGFGPLVLAANPSLGARSVADLVALARGRSAPLSFGSPGVGTPPHLAGELFKREAGIAAIHVPYKSGGQAASDLVAGHVHFSIEGITALLPHIKAGRLVALATTGTRRVASMPDVPTVQESVPGYFFNGWAGLAVPAGTPPEVVDRLYRAIAQVLASEEAREWFAANGAETGLIPPAEFAAFMRAEYEKLGKVIREAGIRAE